jgi:Ca-activated chloride channel family protein
MVSIVVPLIALAIAALAEWLHARRVNRVAHLAFGDAGAARTWTRAAGPLRALAIGATTWGLIILLLAQPTPPGQSDAVDPRSIHHLVIALDVSPSMHLVDAGPRGEQSRGDRARDAIRSVLDRLDARRTRVSIVAFYTSARPVVIDTFDPEVAANVLADLPLEHAFAAGKTDLYSGVKSAGDLGKAWRERSAVLLVVSDGDTLPTRVMPTLPSAFASSVVLGVGSPQRGSFIVDHSSRQDTQALQQLAARLSGRYHDANLRHLPTELVLQLVPTLPASNDAAYDLRRLALAAVALGSVILAGLPLLLALAGTGHRPWRWARANIATHSIGILAESVSGV